ncbi:MAG: ATP-binding protein [Candidatus Sumerlaeota bacterium]
MTEELVIISGKGGTGKTSLTASFAALAENAILADCDVDAADMHLILEPTVQRREAFISGHEAVIRQDDCIACGACLARCRFDAIETDGKGAGEASFRVDPLGCEGCGACVIACPVDAIDFPDCHCGEWMVSETRHGTMVHAKLGVAAENSGKLVATVRREAKALAEEKGAQLILVDGPPGIGCPVIASITGADRVLIVTEPTVSGRNDLERVLSLTRHFDIPTMVCINKWDLNPEMTRSIEILSRMENARTVGRIAYDKAITEAQVKRLAVVETDTPVAEEVRAVWNHIITEK